MKHTSIVVAVGLALAAMLSAVPAQAQLQHTFVSSTGSDANSCSLAAPCRHLQTALTNTLAGGEINILESAGYNGGTTVTISQAVSIVAPLGIEAELAPPSGGAAIVINAGASDAVSLRGLSIDGGGVSNTTGILFNTGKSLTVENCVIRHATGNGIELFPSNLSYLTVSNSLVADNGSSGIYVYPSGSGTPLAVFSRVEVNNNGSSGIYLDGTNSIGSIKATVSDSVAAGNSTGFAVQSASGHAFGTLTVVRSVAANNSYAGIYAEGIGATLHLAQSTVTGNTYGWVTDGIANMNSYQDNYINNNSSNLGGVLTVISKQ